MTKPHEIVLRRERIDQDFSELLARVTDRGKLEFEGYDAGPAVEQAMGDVDFEYWLSVAPEQTPKLLLALLQDRFKSIHEIRTWLEQQGIPYDFSSY